MAERASLAVSNPPGVPGLITAEDMRYGIAAGYTPSGLVTARSGFRPSHTDPGKVSATSPTADKFVHVNAFQRIHQSIRSGGTYVMTLDATEDINVLDTQPAHGSGITKHLIIAQQNDIQFSEPDSEMRVRLVLGVAGANADPSLAGYPDFVALARLNIPAGVTTVTNAMIEDLRPTLSRWTVSSGGVLPVESVAERDAIANPYDGLTIWRRDRDWIEVHDGTAWRVQGVAICANVADRNSAITHPRSGQMAMTTDVDVLWQYDGATSSWISVIETGWTDYTPTWTMGTPAGNSTGRYKREGRKVTVHVTFTATVGVSLDTVAVTFTLPPGLTTANLGSPHYWSGAGVWGTTVLADVKVVASWNASTAQVFVVSTAANRALLTPGNAGFAFGVGNTITADLTYGI